MIWNAEMLSRPPRHFPAQVFHLCNDDLEVRLNHALKEGASFSSDGDAVASSLAAVLHTHLLVAGHVEVGVLAPCSRSFCSSSISGGPAASGFLLHLLETTSHSSFLDLPLANLVSIIPALVALSLFLLVGSVW